MWNQTRPPSWQSDKFLQLSAIIRPSRRPDQLSSSLSTNKRPLKAFCDSPSGSTLRFTGTPLLIARIISAPARVVRVH